MNSLSAQEWAQKCKTITYSKCTKCHGTGKCFDHMPGWPSWEIKCYICSGTGYALVSNLKYFGLK